MNFGPLRTGGSFAVQGSFRTEVVPEALAITRELIRVDQAPFTSQEVDDAVAYFTGVSPLRYATAEGVADQAATQVLAGLPDDYVDRSLALLRSVTPDAATEAYRSVVHPDELTLVVVGDADRWPTPLRAAFPISKSAPLTRPSRNPAARRAARISRDQRPSARSRAAPRLGPPGSSSGTSRDRRPSAPCLQP